MSRCLKKSRLKERSAPMPLIFGPVFEVHSGPADGVSSSQWGVRGGSGGGGGVGQ